MTHDHNRQTQRLENFDYASHGAYFITICTQERRIGWFGEVSRNGMNPNAAGEMVNQELKNLPTRFTNLELDEFIIMPDHIHAIFLIGNADDTPNPNNRRGELHVRPGHDAEQRTEPQQTNPSHLIESARAVRAVKGEHTVRPYVKPVEPAHPRGTHKDSIGHIVQLFKTFTTQEYIKGVRESGWPPFEKRFWQRNYWDRVIRDSRELEATRAYIAQNPSRQFSGESGEG
jgi:putative transposase